MWIDKHLELDGMRLGCVVKSLTLLDHSKMQKLTSDDIQDIKNQADNFLRYVMQKIVIAEKRMK